jgi:hypothetical protein
MKAKITKADQSNAQNPPSSREQTNSMIVCTVVKGDIKEIITARFYMSRSSQASVVYCNLWIKGICSGRGSASGCGYHKESAALDSAITSAGITLYGTPYEVGTPRTRGNDKIDYTREAHIDGCGSESMRDALLDIARDICKARKAQVL